MLLDSSLPHDLLNEHSNMLDPAFRGAEVSDTICREPAGPYLPRYLTMDVCLIIAHVPARFRGQLHQEGQAHAQEHLPPAETTPLFSALEEDYDGDDARPRPDIPWVEDDEIDSGDRIVTMAI